MRVLRSDMQHATIKCLRPPLSCRLAARPLSTTNAVAYTRSGLMFSDHDDDGHPGQADNMNVIERGETGKAQRTKHEPIVAARVRKLLGLSFFLPGQQ